MSDPLARFRRFLRELKRRNVYKVAVTYGVVSLVVWQVADQLFPALGFPGWTTDFVVVLTLLGFPIALVLAWAFEMTAEGVRRTPEAEPVEAEGAPEAARSQSRLALKVLVGLSLLAVAGVAGWYLMGGGGETEPRAGDRSIAVLPFDNLSGTEEAEPFVNGIHDDLLTRLSNVSGLRVISRTSVLRYRNSELSLPAIADSLGVAWIVEGGVQQAGDQVRVNAQLIQAEQDAHRWAESYQRELTTENLFAVQSELTKKIARSLEAELSPREEARVERQPTGDVEAYRIYVQGRTHLDQRTEPGMRRAEDFFRRAIARDSGYALAWVGLADALTLLGDYGYADPDSVFPPARRAVERALRLDPRSGAAHASLGLLHYVHRRGPAAIRELRRAVELRPSYAEAHNWLAYIYYRTGRPLEGLESARRAVELDPLSPEAVVNVALGRLSTGDPKGALTAARRTRQLQPDFLSARLVEATSLYELGRLEEARRALRGLELAWARSAPRALGALVDVAAGDTASARETLRRLGEEAETPFYTGLIRAALGERASALSTLGQIEGWGASPLLAWPNLSARYLYPDVLGPLRGDEEYRRLIRAINRAWGLNPDGSLPDSVDVTLGSQSDG